MNARLWGETHGFDFSAGRDNFKSVFDNDNDVDELSRLFADMYQVELHGNKPKQGTKSSQIDGNEYQDILFFLNTTRNSMYKQYESEIFPPTRANSKVLHCEPAVHQRER
jgi:hypothetical protein